MHNDHYETLLARAVTKGALQHEQIGEILNFRLFGNKRGYLTLENLPVGDIPPTPPSREQLNKPDESSERLLLQATALLGEPIGYLQESDGCIVNNFFPLQTQSRAANSDSFDTELDLHTENAFHAVVPDYLVLLCLRQTRRRSGDLHRLHRAHPRASDLRRAGLLPHRAVQLPV